MNEELQNAIQQLITKTLNGVNTSVDFLSAELPDYIYQLLLWYGVYNFILFLASILLFILFLYIYIKGLLPILKKWIEDDKSNGDDAWPGCIFLTGLYSAISLVITIGISNLTWLKIWIAPKVWLLEYARDLI